MTVRIIRGRVITMRIPDNFDAYDAYEREQERWLAKRPKCEWCGEPIQDDYAYRIDDDLVCTHCVDECMEVIEDEDY